MTSIKTATVNVRIQENVKVEAEAILKKIRFNEGNSDRFIL
ncbi:hypothetical protein [uncultured Gemella sp.]|nr:hypothetical protein [uncultured Gemella sp.]